MSPYLYKSYIGNLIFFSRLLQDYIIAMVQDIRAVLNLK